MGLSHNRFIYQLTYVEIDSFNLSQKEVGCQTIQFLQSIFSIDLLSFISQTIGASYAIYSVDWCRAVCLSL